MKQKFKQSNGVALLTVVLAIIITLVVGCGVALTIRMAITGEEFLAPVKEFFGAEVEDDEEDKEDKEEKEDKDDKDDKDELVHYHGEIQFEDYTGDDSLEYADLVEINVEVYATETEVDEIVLEFDLKDFLENYYEAYEDELVASGMKYEDFRDLMMDTFETSFASGFSTSGSDVEDVFEVTHPEEEVIEMSMSKAGIDNLYESYNIEDGDSIQPILEGLEDSFGIKLEEV